MRENSDNTGAKTPAFFADAMLGSLARWMRALGYDVEYENSIGDKELVERAAKEGRTILTRDHLLVKRRLARGRSLFITGVKAGEQLRQVVADWGLPEGLFLTRCLRCNTVLVAVDKEAVEEKVPQYIYRTNDRFTACLKCARVYWAGSHRDNMLKDVEKLLGGR